ncbi:hypothetical protein [Natronosalvus vescus]|uniref:hypothetical protein n=1 Tax=Natronosalvus vescus TaxID=2953881 RepID=UPI002091E071|nr:hypothetical protein [Natronosalvus vescus]
MPEGTTDSRLRDPTTLDWRLLPAVIVVGLLVVRSTLSLWGAESFPWALLVGAAFGAFLVFGPFAWLARGLLEASAREVAVLVGFGLAILALPFALTAMLVLELPFWFAADAFVVGSILGVAGVFAAERTGLPERIVSAATVVIEMDD